MSTKYSGKIYFTTNDLQTKYDIVKLDISLKSDLSEIFNYKYQLDSTDWCRLNNRYRSDRTNVDTNVDRRKNREECCDKIRSPLEEWMEMARTECVSVDERDCERYEDSEVLEPASVSICKRCTPRDETNTTRGTNTKFYKRKLLDTVSQSMLFGLKDFSVYTSICFNIADLDPEFLLKMSLYCRVELNMRTISNFLLGLAAHLDQSKGYLGKYFNKIVALPTDWIETVYYYMSISNSTTLPNQLRKALINKFSEFSSYQFGKYQHKSMEIEVKSKKIKLTIKNLIRILHISEPADHVMSLLGKKYPLTNEEFILSKLSNTWDETKAGKRMKIPIPETWETQISIHGNRPEIWEKLIDNKTLPYMAMIRNLRNLLQSNIKISYHVKVAKHISTESNVIKGKLLPFQYFTAFKILEEYNETILKAEEKLKEVRTSKQKFSKKNQQKRMQKIKKLRSISSRPQVSQDLIKRYTDALNKAIQIATLYNVPPIRGKIVILSSMNEGEICPSFKYGSSKSIKEVIALVTSMCCFAAEYVQLYLLNDTKVYKFQSTSKHKSILHLSKEILAMENNGGVTPNKLLEEMVIKQVKYDMILTFDVSLSEDAICNYIKYVNPSVLFFINSLKNESTNGTLQLDNVFHFTGFSENTVRLIAEQSHGNVITKIDSIDEKYRLNDSKIYDISNVTPQIENNSINNSFQKEINIFISSTFMDMEKERSIINKIVIPAVKKALLRKNINFVDINCIDLRWGVPSYYGRSEKLLQYCIEQVKRCHIFVGVLGFRYGWVPEPDIIQNLSQTYPELKEYQGLSITNIEYKIASSNCHKVFLIKSDSNEDSVDQEELGIFRSTVKTNECCYEYSSDNLPNDFQNLISYLNKLILERIIPQDHQKLQLCEKHQRLLRLESILQETQKFLKYYTEINENIQKEEIKKIISLLETKLAFKTDTVSINENKGGKSSNKKSADSGSKNSGCGGILIIEGKLGSGKTTVLAQLIQQFTSSHYQKSYNISQTYKKLYFIWIFDAVKAINMGRSKEIYLFDLIYDIIQFLVLNNEIMARLKKELKVDDISDTEFWIPSDINHAFSIWYAALKTINEISGTQITIFVDGIEHLKDFEEASTLNWVPQNLPRNFRLVLTTVADSKLSICSRLRKDSVTHEIGPIPVHYKKQVIETLLNKIGKSLDSTPFSNHMSEFTLKHDSNKPLYLKMAVNHLVLYATYDKIQKQIHDLPSTLDALVLYSLKSMENEIPNEITKVYFSFIINSKMGFKKEDLQLLMCIYFRVAATKHNYSLTSNDHNALKEASKLSLSFSIYPLILIQNLSQLLVYEDDNGRIHIKNSYIKKIISNYVSLIDRRIINHIISLYYEHLLLSNDPTAYRDIIYYQYCSGLYEECAVLLTDINYLKKRFDFGIAEGLLDDYFGFEDANGLPNKLWSEISSRQDFKDFKNFIFNNFEFLIKHPNLFLQQAINELETNFVNIKCRNVTLAPFDFESSQSLIIKRNKIKINGIETNSFNFSLNSGISFAALAKILKIVSVGYNNGLIQICNLNTFQVLFNLRKHLFKVTKLYFFESDKKLLSVSEDTTALVWNSLDGTLLSELKGHSRPITDCTYSTNSSIIATGGLDSQLILWKSGTYSLDHSYKTKSPINCIANHPVNDLKIMIGCWNGSMIIYNIVERKRVAVLHDRKSVKSISFHPFYDLFLSSNIIGEISIWNSKHGVQLKVLSPENTKFFSTVSYSADGLQIIEYNNTNSSLLGVNIWSPSFGHISNQIALIDVTCVDSNESVIICGTKSGNVIVVTHDFSKHFEQSICDTELTSICLQSKKKSTDQSHYFCIGDYNANVYIIQILENEIVTKLKIEYVHSRSIKVLNFFSNYIISGGEDCSVEIMKIKDYESESFLPPIRDVFLDSILSIDVLNKFILISSKDGSIGFFHLKKRIILNHQIKAHNDWVTAVRFASSTNFISSSNDFSIKIWQILFEDDIDQIEIKNQWTNCENLVSFSVLHKLVNHNNSITSLSFNNINSFISSSADGTIKMWNTNGLLMDNFVLTKPDSYKSENQSRVKWSKFISDDNIIAMDDQSIIYRMNLECSCLINKINDQMEPTVSVFDIHSNLYTISLDGSIKKRDFSDIFNEQSKCVKSYKITHSLYYSSLFNDDDIIISITDVGILLYFQYDTTENIWKTIDEFNLKSFYDSIVGLKVFSSSYLLCRKFRKSNNNEIIIEYNHVTLCFNLSNKSLQKVTRKICESPDADSRTLDVNEIEKEQPVEILQTQLKRYLFQFVNHKRILEIFSINNNEESSVALSKVPLKGYPTHAMIFVNRRNEHFIFIAYLQGNVEIIEFKQYLNNDI